jgi:aspartate/methionine/tyrosine aminotransferase
MRLKTFLLDQWLQQHSRRVEFNLGGSTGPEWAVRELLDLGGESGREALLASELVYAPTQGKLSLRQAIAEVHGVQAEEVMVLSGGAEALLQIFLLAADPGANVIIPFPCFPSYEVLPEAFGYELRRYNLRRENSYQMDLDEVMHLVDRKTKILVVNSPHNPTGATLSNQEIRALHDFATERGIQFVCDEVFHPIYHGRLTESASVLPHATVIGDFSKALSLPGLRLGWIIERDSRRREEYLNAREYCTVSNSPVSEFLGEIAIAHREDILGRTRKVAGRNLQLLEGVLREFPHIIDWVRPQGGMTGFARLVSGMDARPFCQAALSHGLLLDPGDFWGVPDHIRIGFGVGMEWFPRAIERLFVLLRSWAESQMPRLTTLAENYPPSK